MCEELGRKARDGFQNSREMFLKEIKGARENCGKLCMNYECKRCEWECTGKCGRYCNGPKYKTAAMVFSPKVNS